MNFLKLLFFLIEMESVRHANHKIQYSIDRGGESKIMLLVRTSTTTTVKSCRFVCAETLSADKKKLKFAQVAMQEEFMNLSAK